MAQRFLLKAIYFGVGSLLLLVDLIGTTNKGAQRWLYVGGISIQPSELAKIAVILLGAALLGEMLRKRQSISLLNKDTVWPFVGTVIYGILVLKQPDMGTAAIIVALMVGLYILAGLRLREVVGLLGILGAVAVAGAIMAPYRLQRVKVWLDPWSDEANTGYQMVQSLMSIGSGGLTGLPWGQGSGKFFYLPEAHTDFAFAIFCQEWGLLGAAILISVFLLLAAAFFRIAMNTKDERGFILVSGVSCLSWDRRLQYGNGLRAAAVIGVPLSFISYGGTSMLITLASIGLVLSVYRDECKREKLERLSPDTRRTQMRVVSPAEEVAALMKKFLLQNGKKRFAIIGLLIFFGFGTVFLRLIWLQVIQNEELARRAANQVTGKVTKYSPRGAILDCNGEELAVSIMSKSLYVDPVEMQDNPTKKGEKSERDVKRLAADLLAGVLQMKADELYADFTTEARFIWLKRTMELRKRQK